MVLHFMTICEQNINIGLPQSVGALGVATIFEKIERGFGLCGGDGWQTGFLAKGVGTAIVFGVVGGAERSGISPTTARWAAPVLRTEMREGGRRERKIRTRINCIAEQCLEKDARQRASGDAHFTFFPWQFGKHMSSRIMIVRTSLPSFVEKLT